MRKEIRYVSALLIAPVPGICPMSRLISTAMVLLAMLLCSVQMAVADSVVGSEHVPIQTASSELFQFSPPKGDGPVVVRARFELQDVNTIDDRSETFEFTGVLTLTWRDPRQAFDPAVAGVNEKIFTGDYQVNQISPGWYPQVVLVNESGLYQKNGALLRVKPDGTSTLIETLNAAAETAMNMRQFPLDRHRLEAVFAVLGLDKDEVILQVEAEVPSELTREVRVPQWSVKEISTSGRDFPAVSTDSRGVSSALVLSVDVQRMPFYVVRLVVLPLTLIILLSFSVFWMDRLSLGERLSISFIGILTAVTYQIVMSDHLPDIEYVTLIHGFMNLSFVLMCATVVVNLIVGILERQQKGVLADRIDFHCRWAFPLVYFGLFLVMLGVAMLEIESV